MSYGICLWKYTGKSWSLVGDFKNIEWSDLLKHRSMPKK